MSGEPHGPAPTWFTAANLKSYLNIGRRFSTMYGEFTDQVLFKARFQSKLAFSLYWAVYARIGGPMSSAGPTMLNETEVAVIMSCLACKKNLMSV